MLVLYTLIGVSVAIYLAMLAVDRKGVRGFAASTLLGFGALYVPLARRGQHYRLVTSQFIHVRLDHVAMNMFALWEVGTLLVRKDDGTGLWSGATLALLYLATGVVAGAFSLGWRWNAPIPMTAGRRTTRRLSVSAGASGAICGLIGAAAAAGHMLGPRGQAVWTSMVEWAVILLVYGAVRGADNAAHLGGLISGYAFAYLAGLGDVVTGVDDRTAAIALVALVAVCFALALRVRRASNVIEESLRDAARRLDHGDAGGAKVALARALEMYPRNAVGQYLLAVACKQTGDLHGALRAATAACAIDPAAERPHTLLRELQATAPPSSELRQ